MSRLAELYDPLATFKDSFNEVKGLADIGRIFIKCIWDFRFCFKRFDTVILQTVRSAIHIQFNAQSRVTSHRDYWDAAVKL